MIITFYSLAACTTTTRRFSCSELNSPAWSSVILGGEHNGGGHFTTSYKTDVSVYRQEIGLSHLTVLLIDIEIKFPGVAIILTFHL